MVIANLTKQLARPSGWLARWSLARLWNRRNSALNDAAFTLVTAQPFCRVLEVGFGGGYLLQKLLEQAVQPPLMQAAGIDHSLEMLRFTRQRLYHYVLSGKLRLALASAEAIPWENVSLDCIVSVNSIFYWNDPIRAFQEFSRLLSPYGRLVLVYTCSQDLRRRPLDSRSLGLHDPDQLRDWLMAAGFSRIAVDQGQDQHRHFWCIQAERGEKTRI
jgi:SAM-dependent methyltransferase